MLANCMPLMPIGAFSGRQVILRLWQRTKRLMAKTWVTTIGFTNTDAESFFERLLNSGVRKGVDLRLHNTSQLAGFAQADDLAYLPQDDRRN